ncbi:hypothetical protein VTK73DRAFT_2974 [Phialemonium thermophilum]|uniref:Uncharacterized protein n=1 Tax=Phialemonium thermophilum TaxID=223376 RepID=A0ABR3Y226_9PEZI
MCMYQRAYGGAAGETGIEEDGVIGDVPSPAEYFLSNDRDLAEQPGYVPRGNISGLDDDKPLPDLPSEQGEDENDISDAQVSGCEQPSVLSTSESGRNDRELEKRFCVDFDFNPDVEEYYRTRARELRINQEGEKERELQNQTQRARADEALLEELRRTTPRISPPPRRRMPELRLQTAFPTESRQRPPEDSGVTGTEKGGNVVFQIPIVLFEDVERPTEGVQSGQDEEDNEDGELTARPKNGHPYALTAPPRRWNSVTIDEVLHDLEMRTSHLGPFTPRDYDDISPVTRGEWGHFLVEGGLRERTAAVEMC